MDGKVIAVQQLYITGVDRWGGSPMISTFYYSTSITTTIIAVLPLTFSRINFFSIPFSLFLAFSHSLIKMPSSHLNFPSAFFSFLLFFCCSCAALPQIPNEQQQDVIILVARGDDPQNARDRVIIPQATNGQQPPFPCLIAGVGIFEHGQTFTKGNFHYNCRNGTAEVIACIADDMSVIQMGRTFLRNGTRHKCHVLGNTALYEQRSTCFENGVYYDVGDTFRNGSFKVICKDTGVAVLGCFLVNSTDDAILLGESRIIGTKRHSCELTESGRIRYVINFLGCQGQNGTDEEYKPGQDWTHRHIRYHCTEDGEKKVMGCVDDGGLFIELGHDIMMGGTVHRCYKAHNVAYYHRFNCDKERSLAECINSTQVPKRKRTASIRAKRAETDGINGWCSYGLKDEHSLSTESWFCDHHRHAKIGGAETG